MLALACIQDDGKRWTPFRSLELMSDDEERDLGMEFDRLVQETGAVIHDPLVAEFINELGQEIVHQIGPQPFVYRFRVVEARSLNAFAVPGGYVYLHSDTVTRAGSLEELIGVLGHEIAHVKAHHIARLRQKAMLPDILTTLAGLAAAVATGEVAPLMVAQGANLALQLRFTREIEEEADELGATYVTRAGYDASASARFFERILDDKESAGVELLPYLYSHPDVEERIESVRARASAQPPTSVPGPEREAELQRVQRRLALLVESGRSAAPIPPTYDRSPGDVALEQARELSENGASDRALTTLTEASLREPGDPRLAFEIAELLSAQGRHEGAVTAYRRALELDPTRGFVFYRLGLAYRELEDRQRAVYNLEQALLRIGTNSSLRERIEWEVKLLTFGVIQDAGFADGHATDEADTPVGARRVRYGTEDSELVWWARIAPRFVPRAKMLSVRWRSPDGEIVFEEQPAPVDRIFVTSRVALDRDVDRHSGEWTVEVVLRDAVVDRRRVRLDR